MEIAILGAHNIESRTTRTLCIVVDGVLALDTGCLTSSLTFEEQAQLKAIVLSHGHYDHVKDMPAIGMNRWLNGRSLDVYTIPEVFETLETHLLNDVLYPDHFKRPPEKPALRKHVLQKGKETRIADYRLLPIATEHSQPSVGIQLTSPEGRKLFYTSDTGPGLDRVWEFVDPDLLIIELTAVNRWDDFARESGHLTSNLLGKELESFRKLKGYLPRIVTVHMNPLDEPEIKKELEEVIAALGTTIELGYEGMRCTI